MEAVYSNLRSYSDTGTGPNGITFRTYFEAPGKLFFEYKEGADTSFICAAGEKGYEVPEPGFPAPTSKKLVWMADAFVLGSVERDTLELQIAGFTGISMGTAYNVPTMIFPEMAGRQFHESTDAKLLRTEKIAGQECYVVDSKKDETTLWIAVSTYALLKIEERSYPPTQVTTYSPVLNGKIPKGVFVFKPPRRSQ